MTSVLQLGNAGSDAGGISSVLQEFSSWTWPQSTHTFVDTYAQDPRQFGVRRLCTAARTIVRHRRDFDVAHIHLSQNGSFVREGLLVYVSSIVRLRVVATVHGSKFASFARSHRRLVRAVFARCDAIAVLSDSAREVATAVTKTPVTVVPNGVSEVVSESGDVAPLGARRSVVFAGDLSRRKGIDTLLEAWKAVLENVPSAHLSLYGATKDVEIGSSDSVSVLGKQPRKAVQHAIARARILTLPSRAEAFPMALLEAMSAGIPVVASDVGGVRAMVYDEDQLIDADDPKALADALVRFLTNDQLAEAKGRRNLDRFRTQFSPRTIMGKYEALYVQ